MFIDKLETEDFDGFAKKNLGLPVAEFKRGFCDIYVKLDADSYGPCPEFMFDDFTCRGLNNRLSFVMRNAFKKCGENLCLKNSEKNTRLLAIAF